MCPHPSHRQYTKSTHVLVCETHKNDSQNQNVLKEYRQNVIAKSSEKFQNFTTNISLLCYTEVSRKNNKLRENVLSDVKDSAIFMLQTINVGGKRLNLFYDSGCGDIVVKKSAVDALLSLGRAKQVIPGPITLFGVGDKKTECEHGIYSIRLPLKNGMDATLSGVCLDRVTSAFPKYALKEVEKDVRNQCENLPKLSEEVGGETDILIGAKYLKYHPKKIWESDTGLCVLDSCFFSEDGTTGIVGGPHEFFTKIDQQNLQAGKPVLSSYFTPTASYFRDSYKKNNEIGLLGEKCHTTGEVSFNGKAFAYKKPPKSAKIFDEIENAGTEVTFRCIKYEYE